MRELSGIKKPLDGQKNKGNKRVKLDEVKDRCWIGEKEEGSII